MKGRVCLFIVVTASPRGPERIVLSASVYLPMMVISSEAAEPDPDSIPTNRDFRIYHISFCETYIQEKMSFQKGVMLRCRPKIGRSQT